jgi:hypothetical protein
MGTIHGVGLSEQYEYRSCSNPPYVHTKLGPGGRAFWYCQACWLERKERMKGCAVAHPMPLALATKVRLLQMRWLADGRPIRSEIDEFMIELAEAGCIPA